MPAGQRRALKGASAIATGPARQVETPDGHALCYQEWGDPRGTPVFSVHGVPGSRLLRARRQELGFGDLMEDLHVRLVTYDRPGYGQSARRSGRSIADSAADMEVIANDLGLDAFAVEGISSGSPHALAAAALLPKRVIRVACIAPMAPWREMGAADWARGQDEEVMAYFARCAEGGLKLVTELGRQDAVVRRQVRRADPHSTEVLEPTRHGIGGWLDDELAAFRPWGFDVAQIEVPTALWFDPADHVFPAQQAKWLAARIPGSELRRTAALGHGSNGRPQAEWQQLYSWLTEA